MSQNYLEISYLKGSLVLGTAFLLSSCSNISPLTKTNVSTNQTTQAISIKATPAPTHEPAATMDVDWQDIEALADTFYEQMPPHLLNHQLDNPLVKISPIEKAYAKSFGVSVNEARRRLTLQTIGSGIMELIKQDLGAAFVEGYYLNENPDEFQLGITTTNSVNASRFVYRFKQAGLKNLTLPIYIYPISDKTKAQIDELIENITPGIFRRYPDTQGIGYNPITNTINVDIYRKVPNETERQRIETELTELVGHPMTVEFIKDRITTL